MKNHFLITNVGNRNLLFNNNLFKYDEYDLNFTEVTKKCFYNEIHVDITASNILTPALDKYKDDLNIVYLIGSNQSSLEGAKVDQDTFWAAHLLKSVLEKSYSFQVVVVENNNFATDLNTQLNFYLGLLKSILIEKYDYKCILMDVGGTPQQKSSLKQACEFLIENENLIIANQNIQEIETSIVNNDCSRDLLKLEQIINLIEQGQYNSASFLTSALSCYEVPKLKAILDFCHLRIIQLSSDAEQFCSKEKIGHDFFEKFAKPYKCKINGNQRFIDFLAEQKIDNNSLLKKMSFEITEKFHLLKWYWFVEDYTSFILTLQQFIEGVINCMITCYSGYDIYQEYYSNGISLLNNLYIEYPEINKKLLSHFNDSRISLSLPSLIIILEQLVVESDSSLNEFFIDLKLLISSLSIEKKGTGTDQLRNAIAHEGKGVTIQKLSKVLPIIDNDPHIAWEILIDKWQKLFHFPEVSIYHEISNWLIGYIKNAEYKLID